MRNAAYFTAALVVLAAAPALSQDQGAPGITKPTAFAPFEPAARACNAPPGLSRKLTFFQDNDRQFMQGVSHGLGSAARDRGLAYEVQLAADDERRMVEQVETALEGKVGSLVAAPVNAASIAPSLQKAIWSGAFVGTVVPPPATTLLNAPQYLTGEKLADAAARHIAEKLDGRANVVLLTHDSLEFLAPRFKAMRDVLGRLPGVNIVADISPSPVNIEGGYRTMQLILLANPEVDVVLGADTVVLGALRALREAGKVSENQFLGGIDGEPEAVAELKDPASPFRASVALSSPVFGYALGQFAADWLDGKSVPQAMDILPTVLTPENIEAYEADLADPASVYADPARRASYLRMYGTICFDTRDQYVNFPWSSEAPAR